MFCPKCGQRQAADDVRFCSGCGFALNVVSDVLAGGGQLHWRPPAPTGPRPLTARQRGVRQGAMLMLSTLLVVPLVALLGVALLRLPAPLVGIAAVACFCGGLLRIIYAAMLEGHDPAALAPPAAQTYVPPASPPNYLGTPTHQDQTALPPRPAPAYRPRYNTGDLAERPGSVTENTTRLLDRKPDETPKQ